MNGALFVTLRTASTVSPKASAVFYHPLGRKHWLRVGDGSGGLKIAATISIVETCRHLDVQLRRYLHGILPRLADWPITRVAERTPPLGRPRPSPDVPYPPPPLRA